MPPVDINSLDRKNKIAISWSLFWRCVVITIVTSFASGLLGFFLGAILSLFNIPVGLISFDALGAGVGMAFFSWYFYVKWLSSSQLGNGNFKLLLVKAD